MRISLITVFSLLLISQSVFAAGINKKKAIYIALKNLEEHGNGEFFRRPEVWNSPSAKIHPELWFIGFAKKHVQMTNDFIYYFVAIDKATGEVVGSDVLNLSRGGQLESLLKEKLSGVEKQDDSGQRIKASEYVERSPGGKVTAISDPNSPYYIKILNSLSDKVEQK